MQLLPNKEYQPQITSKPLKNFVKKNVREAIANSALSILILSFVAGFGGAVLALYVAPEFLPNITQPGKFVLEESPQIEEKGNGDAQYTPQTAGEGRIVGIVEAVSPSVVSVVATKDVPVFEQFFTQPFGDLFPNFKVPELRQNGIEEQEISAGSGFVAASNIVVTNRHVVSDTTARYTVITNEGKKFDAEVIARDPIEDLAYLRVSNLNLTVLPFGESNALIRGQTVIAIGNALGEFQNSVSTGVVSGLQRTITAGGPGAETEVLRELIQTDAAINPGNSGGPLLNLSGQVIGVNVARATNADNIGFAIPINHIKNAVSQITETGNVKYPFLGVRFLIITPDIQKQNSLPVDFGAWIVRGNAAGEVAVTPGSAADRAGIAENDIILEINSERITAQNPLANIIAKLKVGDSITLKVLSRGEEKTLTITLGERP